MKHLFNIISASALIIAGAVSCNLEEYPTTAIHLEDGQPLIQTEADLYEWENEMHLRFRGCQYGSVTVAEEVQLDGFNATAWFGNNFGGIHRTNADFSSGDDYITGAWGNYYSVIQQCNLILDNSSIEDFGIKVAGPIHAYAHLYRAASYMYLVRHFAKDYNPATAASDLGVPIVLHYDQEERPARESVATVYGQIKTDLDAAADLFDQVKAAAMEAGDNATIQSITPTVRAPKPTTDAVLFLLARYYLDTHQYAEAAAKADAVIGSSAAYALAKTAAQMETEFRNDEGNEPILQYYASTSELPNGMGTFTSASKTDAQGIYFSPYFLPSKRLLDNYEATDLRLACWFDNTLKIRNSGVYVSGSGVYVFKRFLGNPELYTTDYPQSYQAAKPFTVSEMYLIAAEAYLQGGDADTAKERLNALQAARATTATDATMESIQREWTRETIGLGYRLACFKRWGIGYDNRTAQQAALDNNMLMVTGNDYAGKNFPANDIHWVWPIPRREMQANGNLVQNPGY